MRLEEMYDTIVIGAGQADLYNGILVKQLNQSFLNIR